MERLLAVQLNSAQPASYNQGIHEGPHQSVVIPYFFLYPFPMGLYPLTFDLFILIDVMNLRHIKEQKTNF